MSIIPGALASTSNDTTTISYTYDGFGNKIAETESGGVSKTYQYDVHGNLKEYELTVGGEVQSAESYVYDRLDRLTTVLENGNIITSYTYDVNGNRVGKTLANGVTTTYQYNDANWVTNVSNKKDDVVISEYAYTYGLDGTQLQKAEDDGKSVTYTYDSLNRIVNEAYNGAYDNMSISYVYDTYGNRVQKTTSTSESDEVALYTYDKNNRLLTQTVGEQVTEYLYDANGNQIFIDNSDGTYQMYDYTLLNQQAVMYSNGEQINYTYKPDGLRHSVEMDGETKYQYWSGSQLAYEVNGESESVYYLSLETLGRKVNSSNPEYYLYNVHGDVVQLTQADASVVYEYDYDTFGNQLTVNENDDNPLRYNGQYWDEKTQTYYLRARQYNPVTGRFTTEDTHWTVSNMIYDENGSISLEAMLQAGNLYVYCVNNPVMLMDPFGLRTYILNGINNSKSEGAPENINEFAEELEDKGIENVKVIGVYNKTNLATGLIQAGMEMINIGKYADEVAQEILDDLKDNPLADGEKLNLVGYSGGGQIVLNVSELLNEKVTVDNTVLIGAPVAELTLNNTGKTTMIYAGLDPLSWNVYWYPVSLEFAGWFGHTSYFNKDNIGKVADLVNKHID